MVRWIVIGAVVAVAFTIYALVDLIMTKAPRVRAFSQTSMDRPDRVIARHWAPCSGW